MSKVYLNEDVKLKNGGRKAMRSTVEYFDEVLSNFKEKAKKAGFEVDGSGKYDWIFEGAFGLFPKLKKDLSKIVFDFENHKVETDICLTFFSVPYLRCFAGDKIPVKFFVYFDGKDLRGYIPTKGNLFNRKTKSAFGNDGEDVLAEIRKYVGKDISSIEDVDYQEDWMLEDFENRLEITYTSEEIDNKSDELLERLVNLLAEKGYCLEETDMVCEDYDREFIFVCKDNPALNDVFESDRHALLYSYGSKEDECPSYLTIDPNDKQIDLIESENPGVVLDWFENNMDLIVEKLIEFYKEVASQKG